MCVTSCHQFAENMETAQKRDAARQGQFYFRKNVTPPESDTEEEDGENECAQCCPDEYTLMSADTIINGKVPATFCVYLYTHLHTYTAQRPAPTDHSCTYVCIYIRRHSFTFHFTQTIKHLTALCIYHKKTGTHTTYTAPRSFSLPERVPQSHPSHPHVPKLYQHRCGHPLHHPAVPLPHLTAGIRYRS